jgi:site-specific DNA-methyltransferase (adenine-specific)
MPFQPVFQTDLGSLYNCDCLDFMIRQPEQIYDVIFADPPFNLGKDYGEGLNDLIEEAKYLSWMHNWVWQCVRILKTGGALYIYGLPYRNGLLTSYLGMIGMELRHWIAVDMKSSLPIPGRLYPAHYSLLYTTKGKPNTFKRPRVPIPVCRHCGGDIKDYGGHRNKLHPAGLNLSDVWVDLSPVRHNKNKHRSSNELPIKMLHRVLEMSSEPGDLVLDPFGGSGTTYAACEEMGRRWVGVELGDCAPIIARLTGEDLPVPKKHAGDAGKRSKPKPRS